jgi:hypothetical protein
MNSLDSHLLHNPNFMGTQLANSLGGILAALQNELEGLDITQPAPSTTNQQPNLSTLLSHIPNQESQHLALATLIGFPFDQQPIGGGASVVMMRPENQLRSQVAEALLRLWRSGNIHSLLAQLAITVFHFNFLQTQPTPSTATQPTSASSDSQDFQSHSWEEIISLASSNVPGYGWTICNEVHRSYCAKAIRQLSISRDVCRQIRSEMVANHLMSPYSCELLEAQTTISWAHNLYNSGFQYSGNNFVSFLKILLGHTETNALAETLLLAILAYSNSAPKQL